MIVYIIIHFYATIRLNNAVQFPIHPTTSHPTLSPQTTFCYTLSYNEYVNICHYITIYPHTPNDNYYTPASDPGASPLPTKN